MKTSLTSSPTKYILSKQNKHFPIVIWIKQQKPNSTNQKHFHYPQTCMKFITFSPTKQSLSKLYESNDKNPTQPTKKKWFFLGSSIQTKTYTKKLFIFVSKENFTMEIRKEALVDESRSLRPTMTIVDTNIGGGRWSKDLALVFEARISLDHRDGVIPRSVWLEVRMPEKPITATTSTATA